MVQAIGGHMADSEPITTRDEGYKKPTQAGGREGGAQQAAKQRAEQHGGSVKK